MITIHGLYEVRVVRNPLGFLQFLPRLLISLLIREFEVILQDLTLSSYRIIHSSTPALDCPVLLNYDYPQHQRRGSYTLPAIHLFVCAIFPNCS